MPSLSKVTYFSRTVPLFTFAIWASVIALVSCCCAGADFLGALRLVSAGVGAAAYAGEGHRPALPFRLESRSDLAVFVATPPSFSPSISFLQLIPFWPGHFSFRLFPLWCSRVLMLVILFFLWIFPSMLVLGRSVLRSFFRALPSLSKVTSFSRTVPLFAFAIWVCHCFGLLLLLLCRC